MQLANLTRSRENAQVEKSKCVTKLAWSHSMSTSSAQTSDKADLGEHISRADLISTNWAKNYTAWHAEVFDNPETKTPNQKQRQILDLIHDRCVVEHAVKQKQPIPETKSDTSSSALVCLHLFGFCAAGAT